MGKITRNELSPVVTAELDATMRGIAESNEQLGVVVNKSTLRDKELAYLKLKQDANERIEGGTTFADDFGGNGFGITFNAEESENVLNKDGALTMNAGSMIEHVVDDSTVIEGSYNTMGNGGRKLVRLDNGTLVCVLKSSTEYLLYKSTDNGVSWTKAYSSTYSSIQDINISTNGVYVFIIICANNNSVVGRVMSEDGSIIDAKSIQTSQTALGTCSLTINEEGTELHACWSSKNSTYPNSFNIQYCKGIIGEGGSVVWGSVEQVTNNNTTSNSNSSPTIALNYNNIPYIVYSFTNGNYSIISCYKDGSTWKYNSIYAGNSYEQSYPSAIFVPKSVNGLENGRIWVTWQGRDSVHNNSNNIRVSYSDDNGKSWVESTKLTNTIANQNYPNITANKRNEVFITWSGGEDYSGYIHMIRQIKYFNGSWGEIKDVKNVNAKKLYYSCTMYDVNFNIDFTSPLFIYTINSTSINFTGTWQVGAYTPTTTAAAVYSLPSTDYVGLFVQKEGSIDVTATINGEPMERELDGDEYQFTKSLGAANDVTLKLSLSRSDTTNGNNDKITRILGGIA